MSFHEDINEVTPLRNSPQHHTSSNRNSDNGSRSSTNNNHSGNSQAVSDSELLSSSQHNSQNGEIMDDSMKILYKIGTDFLLLVVVGFPILCFFLWGEPYQRGFFCDDESLKHPFHESTVRNYMLYIFGLGLPILLIVLTETIHSRTTSRDAKRYIIFNREIPNCITFAYRQIGVFGFGAACSQLATDIGKYSIGRLRPHFFTVCRPIMPGNTTCDDAINQGRYIEDFMCGALGESTARMLKEMRLSFPSGHSSFSVYTMVYCAIYLQARMTWSWSKLPKHVIQFVLLMLAFYTCLSRISDYKHHWSDVLSGAVLGATVAITVTVAVSDLFSARRRNKLPERYELGRSSTTNGRV